MKTAIKENLRKPQTIISLCVAAVFIVGCIVAYIKFGSRLLEFISDTSGFKAWLEGFGFWGRIIFIGIRAFQTVIKIIPAEPLEIGSGFVYGTFGGCLMCIIGTTIGSLVIVLLTKLFGTKIIHIFVSDEKMHELSFLQNKKRIAGLLWCVYLIPGTPKDLITYFVCVLPISVPKFFLITSIARIPSIISSTWCGAELGESNFAVSAAIFGATFVLSLIGVVIYKRFQSHESKKYAESPGEETAE